MKKIVVLTVAMVAALMVVPSCNKGNGDQANKDSLENMALRDSIATIRAEKDTLASLMSDVTDGMNEILDLQEAMSVGNLSSESTDRKNQLRSQVEGVQRLVADRTQRLQELEKRLSQSTAYSEEMKKQVASLKKQLEKQQGIINQLTADLQAAHVQIKSLNTRVDSLNVVNTQTKADLSAEKRKVEEETARNESLTAHNTSLTNEMNECYYVVGSKSELKKQKIIETGFLRKTKVMEGDYTKSYFTKADKRSLNEIQLHNRHAEVMSKHPSGSYEIVDVNGQKVLKIINAKRFWELSNYLVVKVG